MKDRLQSIPAKLGIIQRTLPHYRVPFFDRLAQRCDSGLQVFSGSPQEGEGIRLSSNLEYAKRSEARNHYLGRLGSDPWAISWQSNLISWLNRWNPDLLVVEANPRLVSNWIAILYMGIKSRPVIGWGLGKLPRSRGRLEGIIIDAITTRLWNSFSAMIAYGTKAATDYQNHHIPPEKIFIAHNAINTEASCHYLATIGANLNWMTAWKEKNGLHQSLPIILFVGRLTRAKKVGMLIEACEPLAEAVQLLIVGDGPFRSSLEEKAGCGRVIVRFMGHQEGDDLARSFIASDLFVLPGSGGLAVHQAMSYGLPVICSFGDGTEADLVHDGTNGWIVPADDVDALRRKIEEIISRDSQLAAMGKASSAIIRDKFSIEHMVNSFVGAINATLEQ